MSIAASASVLTMVDGGVSDCNVGNVLPLWHQFWKVSLLATRSNFAFDVVHAVGPDLVSLKIVVKRMYRN